MEEKTKKSHESKLAALSVFNDALQKENAKLRELLRDQEPKSTTTDKELKEVTQEFTHRLALAEKDNQKLKETIDILREKINAFSLKDRQDRSKLREDYIANLQGEGEALSRKNGELEASLRKLKNTCQEHDVENTRLKEKLKNLDEKCAKEKIFLKHQLEEANQNVINLQSSLEKMQADAVQQINAALKEGAAAADLAKKDAALGGSHIAQEALERELYYKDAMTTMQEEFEQSKIQWNEKEETLRKELNALQSELQSQEFKQRELHLVSTVDNQPLLRQIEALTKSMENLKRSHLEHEFSLKEQVHNMEVAKQVAVEAKSIAEMQCEKLGLEVACLKNSLTQVTINESKLKEKLNSQFTLNKSTQEGLSISIKKLSDANKALNRELNKVRDEKHKLELSLQQSQEENLKLKTTTDDMVDNFNIATLNTTASCLEDSIASETLQNTKDEVLTLKSRLAAAEALAEKAQEELFIFCQQNQQHGNNVSQLDSELKAKLKNLQAKHELALELLGERNERVESLEDDVREMKLIFHTQLSSLVDELNDLKNNN